jgi:hypothetical protein
MSENLITRYDISAELFNSRSQEAHALLKALQAPLYCRVVLQNIDLVDSCSFDRRIIRWQRRWRK